MSSLVHYNDLLAISDSTSLSSYLSKVNAIPSLTLDQEQEMARKMIEFKDLKSIQSLILSHLKLVAKIAMKYKKYGLPMLDLISEGNMGLIHGVKKFDPSLGFRLSTYASWWINASIKEYIVNNWSLVKICTTVGQKKLFYNLSRLKAKIQGIEDKSLSVDQVNMISKQLGVTKPEVELMDQRLSAGHDLSLNTPLGEGEKQIEAIELIPSNSPTPIDIVSARQVRDLKMKMFMLAFDKIDDRSKEIIRRRYLEDPQSTLQELAQDFGISTERIRQIEERAIKQMQKEVQQLQHSGTMPMLS